jgi:hypothetical protein
MEYYQRAPENMIIKRDTLPNWMHAAAGWSFPRRLRPI